MKFSGKIICGARRESMVDAVKLADYQRMLNPPRQRVTQDQFDQILYDAIHRDKTQPPAAIERWAHRHYEVLTDAEQQRPEDFGPNGDSTTATYSASRGVGRKTRPSCSANKLHG